jgi:hypothetical protein
MAYQADDIQGTLINSFDEYRSFISTKYTKKWLSGTISEIYEVFGKPLRYPFIFIELNRDYEDSAYESTKLTKVYF